MWTRECDGGVAQGPWKYVTSDLYRAIESQFSGRSGDDNDDKNPARISNNS